MNRILSIETDSSIEGFLADHFLLNPQEMMEAKGQLNRFSEASSNLMDTLGNEVIVVKAGSRELLLSVEDLTKILLPDCYRH